MTLIVEAGDRPPEELSAAIEDANGTVAEHLQFDSLRVRIAQERTDDLCEIDGIASITTDDAVGGARGRVRREFEVGHAAYLGTTGQKWDGRRAIHPDVIR